jgi:hypothetical protein
MGTDYVTDVGVIEARLDGFADVKRVSSFYDAHVFEFDIVESSRVQSLIELPRDGELVRECTLRFPIVESGFLLETVQEAFDAYAVAIGVDGFFETRISPYFNGYAPHFVVKRVPIDHVLEQIEYVTEVYDESWAVSLRPSE